jgi:hypothetical protein
VACPPPFPWSVERSFALLLFAALLVSFFLSGLTGFLRPATFPFGIRFEVFNEARPFRIFFMSAPRWFFCV